MLARALAKRTIVQRVGAATKCFADQRLDRRVMSHVGRGLVDSAARDRRLPTERDEGVACLDAYRGDIEARRSGARRLGFSTSHVGRLVGPPCLAIGEHERSSMNAGVTCPAQQLEILRIMRAAFAAGLLVVNLEPACRATAWGLALAVVTTPHEAHDRGRYVLCGANGKRIVCRADILRAGHQPAPPRAAVHSRAFGSAPAIARGPPFAQARGMSLHGTSHVGRDQRADTRCTSGETRGPREATCSSSSGAAMRNKTRAPAGIAPSSIS